MEDSPRQLAGWLAYIESIHPSEIELGLDRVRAVAARMGLERTDSVVFSIAGTNGKGSCAATLERLLLAGGRRVGVYTSPHLSRFNERVKIDGRAVDDAALCLAFEAVESARADIELTYFEFATLAALELFARARPDCLVLEVGLGGRLDAVNVIDADFALVTGIQIDHTDWLGSDRESIAREKAGIFRPSVPAICADRDPPRALRERAEQTGSAWFAIGGEFDCGNDGHGRWYWRGCDGRGVSRRIGGLRAPQLVDSNVACAMQALMLASMLPSASVLAREIPSLVLPGRFQRIDRDGLECVLDVAHNAAGIELLVSRLRERPCRGRTAVIFGAMRDKDLRAMLAPLQELAGQWLLVDLPDVPRAAPAQRLEEVLRSLPGNADISIAPGPVQALRQARAMLAAGDRLLVCGSFHVVGPALDSLRDEALIGE